MKRIFVPTEYRAVTYSGRFLVLFLPFFLASQPGRPIARAKFLSLLIGAIVSAVDLVEALADRQRDRNGRWSWRSFPDHPGPNPSNPGICGTRRDVVPRSRLSPARLPLFTFRYRTQGVLILSCG
ncbi:MAG: hypothetical protein METHP_00542 [Methanoregula sp. SKADARSKE-2]|nr:MAG: hypothetical protein METHP_00542 [Methanoregula sp. SKADARSKE-2]